jgi:sugar phosphate isomerase/epimerase
MDRRTFARTLGALIAAPAALPTLAGAAPAGRVGRVGLQLYSLRDAARQNLERTLESIAAVGYNDVELLSSMNNFDTPAARVRQMLDRYKLRAPSTHIGVEALDDLPRQLDDAKTLGHEYLVVASFPEQRRGSLADYRYWADRLNRAGEVARKAGVWIGWHDEPYDFAVFDGQVAYDVVARATDPALVRLQLDTGNAALGGRQPLQYLERYADRYWSFHVKDVPRMSGTQDAELGKGILDLKRLLARIPRLGEKHLFVEQESYPTGDPLASVRRDYEYMRKLKI